MTQDNDDGRDKGGKFKKGKSGNPRGRPKSQEMERGFTSSQVRRDILSVTEELVTVQTPDGPLKVPFHVANLLKMRAKASNGHGPSQRHLHKLHMEAIARHEEVHGKELDQLDQLEMMDFKNPDHRSDWLAETINKFRKYSRNV